MPRDAEQPTETKVVQRMLYRCLHEGCRSSCLQDGAEGRVLVDRLLPRHLFSDAEDVERFVLAADLMSGACGRYPEWRKNAALILLGLDTYHGYPLGVRREAASKCEGLKGTGVHLGGNAENFRKNYEQRLLRDVAFELIVLAQDVRNLRDGQLRLDFNAGALSN